MEPQNSSKSLASQRKTMKNLSDSKIQIDGHLTTTGIIIKSDLPESTRHVLPHPNV